MGFYLLVYVLSHKVIPLNQLVDYTEDTVKLFHWVSWNVWLWLTRICVFCWVLTKEIAIICAQSQMGATQAGGQ